jgi:hypothetical protein
MKVLRTYKEKFWNGKAVNCVHAQLLGRCIFLKEKKTEDKRRQEKREVGVYAVMTSSRHKQLILLGVRVTVKCNVQHFTKNHRYDKQSITMTPVVLMQVYLNFSYSSSLS